MVHTYRLIIQYHFLSWWMITDLMVASPDNGLRVLWTLVSAFPLTGGVGMFFPGKSLSRFKVNSCCSCFFSPGVSSFPLHGLIIKKHSGIPRGIKIADGHSRWDEQALPLEASNSNSFSPWFRDAGEKRFGRAKMLLEISHTSRTGGTCRISALPYTTDPSGECGCNLPAASKALGLAPLGASSRAEKGERGRGASTAGRAPRPAQLGPQEPRRERALKQLARTSLAKMIRKEETLNQPIMSF